MKVSYNELNVNGYIIRGLFSTPDNGEYKSVVVFLHGYTGHKNETSFLFKQLSARFVEEGYATLRYDYYGSGDSDGEFHNQTLQQQEMTLKLSSLNAHGQATSHCVGTKKSPPARIRSQRQWHIASS